MRVTAAQKRLRSQRRATWMIAGVAICAIASAQTDSQGGTAVASQDVPVSGDAGHPAIAKAEPLTRFVPAASRFYVHAHRLAHAEALVQETHVGPFLQKIARTTGVDPNLLDLRARMASFLNLTSSMDLARLARLEVGMISTGPTDTASAVWLTRMGRPAHLRDWFSPERRTAETSSGPVVSFATDDGFTVCMKSDIVAMGRRQRGRSILREVYNNLTADGNTAKSLELAPHYRDLAAELPPGAALTAYLSYGGSKGAGLAPWSPVLVERVLLGAYNDQGNLHLAARGLHGQKTSPPALHPSAVEAFLRLPSTVYGAIALHADPSEWQAKVVPFRELVTMLQAVSRPKVGGNEAEVWQSKWEDIGPEVIAVWGQPHSVDGSPQQLGVMIRCRDSRAVRSDVSRLFADGIRWIGGLDGITDEQALPKFKLVTHLGTPIVYIALGDYTERSALSWLQVLEGSTPAWTAWGDWFIVSTSLEHLQRLLDAQNGLIPSLAVVPELQQLLTSKHTIGGLGIIQPAVVGGVLDEWSAELEALPESHWFNALWTDALQFVEGNDDRLWLDVFEFAGQRGSGTVSVARVDAESGKIVPLQAGDLVIGINDRLLALSDPLGTLANAWDSGDGDQILKVRVIRSGKAFEVDVVPGTLDRGGMATMFDSPAKAARNAAELMRGVTFAGWSWRFGADQHFSADVLISCTADQPPRQK